MYVSEEELEKVREIISKELQDEWVEITKLYDDIDLYLVEKFIYDLIKELT